LKWQKQLREESLLVLKAMIVPRRGGLLLRQSSCCVGARRSFFSSPPQKFTIHKTLPYNKAALFKVISDIDSYKTFVPFCTDSTVTRKSEETQLPTRADLKVGFKQYEESFSSHVRCTPDSRVEAVASDHPLFKKLVAAWRLSGDKEGACQVHLDIEYQFTNPLYGAVSAAVVPKVAGQVLEAFEKHADAVLER
jgi:coenzyme Q-binding protein COQ10